MRYLSKVDFQAHYLPPAYLDFLARHHPGEPDGYPTPDYWTMEWQREKMRLLGIAYAHLMLSSPNIYTDDRNECRDLARLINDQGAAMAESDPDHIGLIATLPLPYESESVAETRRALDSLHADGIGLTTNHHGVYLGDPRLDGVMRELNERGAMAIIHPTAPPVAVPGACEGLSLPAFEYFVETTRAFTNMVMHDVFVTYPNIRWVLPHAGAFTSILADRFESFALILRFADPDRTVDFMDSLAHVYFDLAGFSERKQLGDLLLDVPDTHLLYGSDTPYTPIEACLGQALALEGSGLITEAQKRKVFTGNALDVNPKLRAIPGLAMAADTPAAEPETDRDAAADRGPIRIATPAARPDGGAGQGGDAGQGEPDTAAADGQEHGLWHIRLLRKLFPRRHVSVPVPIRPSEARPVISDAVAEIAPPRFAPDAGDDPASVDYYSVRLASPVGTITIPVLVAYDDATTFHGKAKVMGIVAPFRDGERNGRRHTFDLRVRLPFGPLNVHLDADIDDQGRVTGRATAPNRRPMPLAGRRVEAPGRRIGRPAGSATQPPSQSKEI